jgi:2-octaprenylphenol hydroxylase
MHIWDKAGYGQLFFDDSQVDNPQLGYIIENKVIRNCLWAKAEQDSGISFYTQAQISSLGMGDEEVFASFDTPINGQTPQLPIMANLVIGADGANSWLRQQLDIPMVFRDYDHHAIVATVACSQGHQNTAWQVFLPTGPLAFLPLANEKNEQQLASIVWSTSPDEAKRLSALSPEAFNKEITAAADGKLGVISLASERFSYPLTMRLAQNFMQERAILIGDAAHTIHPLAGQGVNLGLKDAAALAECLSLQVENNSLTVSQKTLKNFERWRKSDAAEMIAAMEAIKQVFNPQQKPTQLLRGIGMNLLNNLAPVKQQMIKQALGYQHHLPSLAKLAPKIVK